MSKVPAQTPKKQNTPMTGDSTSSSAQCHQRSRGNHGRNVGRPPGARPGGGSGVGTTGGGGVVGGGFRASISGHVERQEPCPRKRRKESSRVAPGSKKRCNLRGDSLPYLSTKFMADLANKYTENVTGEFYVDDQCIDCDLCRETAPANFTRNDDGGHSYVYKQPMTDEEKGLCKEAMEGCPVEAIGADGV